MLIGAWAGIVAATDFSGVVVPVIAVGGVIWCASTMLLLWDYRHRIAAHRSRTTFTSEPAG